MEILIVDDNATDRKLLRLIFEKHGYRSIREAEDGLDGLEKARALLPDLIVSDALMPRMDGYQFLWALKMDAALREIPFVFHSGVYNEEKDEELAVRLGAEGFIARPKEPDEFWREMAAILDRLASGRRTPPPPDQLHLEREYLRNYNDLVAGKLEMKVRELEDALAVHTRVEEELRKLSLVVEQSPVSIIITNLKGEIEYVNPRFCQITGYAAAEVAGANPRILNSGKIPRESYRRLWETISAGGVWRGELHNKRKNGELYWESATIAPVKNRKGELTHYIAIKEDITERKKLEEQLLHAQKMEALGTLAGGVAHDFNNILTGIMGFSAMLRMKMPDDDPLLGTVAHIEEAAERAAGLTAALLACSRKQQIETKVVDLNQVVEGIRNMLRRLVREDIELRIVQSDAELPVLADKGQLEQVLLNLATNATDAMTKNGTITITTATAEPGEGDAAGTDRARRHALLTFADTGAGMEESIRQRIFEPFFTTKEVGKGTGLGLSICYGIITQHDGRIECHSEPGSGTAFRIYLPLVQKVEEGTRGTESSPPTGGTETILVAEDDPSTMCATSEILTEFGYRVLPAADGEEAVAIYGARWRDIDLCLLDVVMPKKRGCEALDDIRRINPAARVLLMSGYSTEVTALGRKLDGDAGFLPKPLGVRDLLKRVREALDR